MGTLGSADAVVTRLAQLPENVWLVALGLALLGPLVAVVVPRLSRVLTLVVVPAAFALSLLATLQQQTMVALGLITLACTAGFVASWSTRTVREAVGPMGGRQVPRHRHGAIPLSGAQSRSLDYLLMR